MYECPGCGQNLKFDISLQKLKCAYCDGVYDPYSIGEKHSAKTDGEDTLNGETFQITSFVCPQCGGEILGDETETATFCSYCGASTILNSRLVNTKRPKMIIPFKKTKKDCVKSYKALLAKSPFVDSELKDAHVIDSFRAIYMPYWVYDLKRNGKTNYKAKTETQKGDYLYTKHYNMSTDINLDYKGVSFDASSIFPDTLSSAIGPYNAMEALEFTPAFMSGFYADTNDVDDDTYKRIASEAVANECASKLARDKQNSRYIVSQSDVAKGIVPGISNARLAMFPVWFMALRKKLSNGDEKVAYCVVNGATGRAAGDLPSSTLKYLIGSLLLAIPFFLLFELVMTITPTALVVLASIMAVIVLIALGVQSSAIDSWAKKEGDLGVKASKAYSKKYEKTKKQKTKEEKKHDFSNGIGAIVGLTIISIIINGIVLFSKPVSDLWYYGAVAVECAMIFVSFSKLIKRVNLLTTRPLPQFKKQGGDDHANI